MGVRERLCKEGDYPQRESPFRMKMPISIVVPGTCEARDSTMIIQYIDQIISFAAGVWITTLGYGRRYGAQSGDEPQHQKIRRLGKLFRVTGPLLIGVSLILAAGRYYTASQS
jgi:hypothetical protein